MGNGLVDRKLEGSVQTTRGFRGCYTGKTFASACRWACETTNGGHEGAKPATADGMEPPTGDYRSSPFKSRLSPNHQFAPRSRPTAKSQNPPYVTPASRRPCDTTPSRISSPWLRRRR
jgi:hypothetical protein